VSTPEIFFDASALFAGVISSTGAARALMLLGEAKAVTVIVSEQVLVEAERNLAQKAPQALPYYRQALRAIPLQVRADPLPVEVAKHTGIIAHTPDVPILVAAMQAQSEFLVTLNRKHFIDDPEVARKSGLRIGGPGDALAWLRSRLSGGPSKI
jgi:predicted nucleic acid-binding protein